MIRQKPITIKTVSATLTYAEMGDIVCNSSSAITITLPSPNEGLWYRISNAGTGLVTVYYGSELTTLKQTEQCLLLSNSTSSWFFSKGGGAMTKAEIEAILTGIITSHSHPDNVITGTTSPTNSTVGTIGQFYLDTAIPKLYQCTAINAGVYTWIEVGSGSSSYTLQQATETTLGGIRAAEKTSGETQEVKIDTATGKLYSTPPTSATNGLPSGGTAGQILSKIDGDDYNAEWIDMQSSSGNPTVKSSLLNYGSSNTATVVIPDDAEVGDLIIIMLCANYQYSTIPSGFDLISAATGSYHNSAIFAKICENGDESATISIPMGGSEPWETAVVVVEGWSKLYGANTVRHTGAKSIESTLSLSGSLGIIFSGIRSGSKILTSSTGNKVLSRESDASLSSALWVKDEIKLMLAVKITCNTSAAMGLCVVTVI